MAAAVAPAIPVPEGTVGPKAVPIEQFVWPELAVAGGTATSQAIRLLTGEL